jgi:hypothetical protein
VTTQPPDPIAAYLAQVKADHRQHVSVNFPAPGICVSRCAGRWPCSSSRLAAGLEEARKLAGRWAVSGNGYSAQSQCAAELRDVITRKLLSSEGDDHASV